MKQLQKYRKKRNLKLSGEPDVKATDSGYPLPIFVIQRHDARNLHFDLRLEHNGALLSWAITKRPVLNKSFKRLAVKVEDHPLDYANFSGLIPKGNYGAGVVSIWDRGFYFLENATNKNEIQKTLDEKLLKGHFIIYLKGRKLKGKFVLVRIGKSKDDWLFYYDNDDKREPDKEDDGMFFGFVPPMIPTLSPEPFEDPEWLYEPKLDGYRVISVIDREKVRLYSRNGKELTSAYPQIVRQLSMLSLKAILDGEVIALDEEGKPDFSLLHSGEGNNTMYYLFDILYYKRSLLTGLTLSERKRILEDRVQDSRRVRKLPFESQRGMMLYDKVVKLGFEGIVAKKKSSVYQSGRSKHWLKIKKDKTLDLVVIGYTPDDRGGFKSLMIGEADGNHLTYRGNVGTGFSEQDKETIMKFLKIIPRPRNISNLPVMLSEIFVKPDLLVEVGYLEVTDDGRLRHPVFKRIRDDK